MKHSKKRRMREAIERKIDRLNDFCYRVKYGTCAYEYASKSMEREKEKLRKLK